MKLVVVLIMTHACTAHFSWSLQKLLLTYRDRNCFTYWQSAATFAVQCSEYPPKKNIIGLTVLLGPSLKVHSLFYDSELCAEYLILKLF